MQEDPSILIVGAGPVGLTLALELARRGLRPRIIDRKDGPTPADESRALAINLRTLHLLTESGAAQDIITAAHPVHEMRMTAGEKQLMTVNLREDIQEIPDELPDNCRGIHALPQGTTERILIERLASYGIWPEWNRACIRLDQSGDSAALELLSPSGARSIAKAALVVGADGAHSTIREQAGFTFPGTAVEQRFYLADFSYYDDFDNSYVELTFLDPGTIVRIPIDDRRVRFVSTLPDFRDHIEHPATISQLLWDSDFEVSFRHVDRMHNGSVFLAGDAAHVHSPIGGRGMNLGIEDACWLAWLISQERQSEYTKSRIPAVKQVLAETFRNTRLVLMRNPFAVAARNFLAPRLAGRDSFRRRGLRGVLGLDTSPPPWLSAGEGPGS